MKRLLDKLRMGIRADEMVALHIAEGKEHLNAKELEKAHESYTKAYEAIFSLKETKQQELFPSMHDLYRDIVALQDEIRGKDEQVEDQIEAAGISFDDAIGGGALLGEPQLLIEKRPPFKPIEPPALGDLQSQMVQRLINRLSLHLERGEKQMARSTYHLLREYYADLRGEHKTFFYDQIRPFQEHLF